VLLIHPEGGQTTRKGGFVTTNSVLGFLLLGGAGGWIVGRWWAENARARFDQRKTWEARKNCEDHGALSCAVV
jgi:hypothetical protein